MEKEKKSNAKSNRDKLSNVHTRPNDCIVLSAKQTKRIEEEKMSELPNSSWKIKMTEINSFEKIEWMQFVGYTPIYFPFEVASLLPLYECEDDTICADDGICFGFKTKIREVIQQH